MYMKANDTDFFPYIFSTCLIPNPYFFSLFLSTLLLIESFNLLKRKFSYIVTYNMIILYSIMEPTLKMVSLESSWNKYQEVRTLEYIYK